MTDLFHDKVPFGWIYDVLKMTVKYPQHTYIILTKRPQRMKDFFTWLYKEQRENWMTHFSKEDTGDFIPNLWLGVTAENQEQAQNRVPLLLEIPAAIRFVSIEPLLGKINLSMIVDSKSTDRFRIVYDPITTGTKTLWDRFNLLREEDIPKLDWIIVGGESGKNARPMHPNWVTSIKEQCKQNSISFFFKQWGEWIYRDYNEEILPERVGKKQSGDFLDGLKYNEFPTDSIIVFKKTMLPRTQTKVVISAPISLKDRSFFYCQYFQKKSKISVNILRKYLTFLENRDIITVYD